ncbi:hypothetical protein, partial [Streptomyces sp. NPDC057052]|uniref:hypothetical protein n=1 Tax=Streptomyces sp. NPDC057052 TaxID=3346010 RepID=UPI003633EC46
MIAVARLMAVPDATIVNVALPRVRSAAGISTENPSPVADTHPRRGCTDPHSRDAGRVRGGPRR